ncbi:MAG: Adaptive-response sensory-kinase SasA [Phycisphaerae bacterium]|nr:Adaptive-response sensory-kinase SasA [Phycisphaerae bacterium]
MKTRKTQNRSMKSVAHERVKELSCLYAIAQLAADQDLSLDRILQGIVELLPPAWQHPEAAQAEIRLGDRAWRTPGFRGKGQTLASEIHVGCDQHGRVCVEYVTNQPVGDEAPFLKEERQLIDGVARQVAMIVERREAEQAREELFAQLQQADRLATIGVLAAGVAHELNEPLNDVLGFAELVTKVEGLPAQALADLKKIENAALQAREIIRNLLVFVRRLPPGRKTMNLNQAVHDGLQLLTARCVQNGIELAVELASEPSEVHGDPLQLNQVLVNLIVNAIQAMPCGGKLLIRTENRPGQAVLTVQDTGIGMDQETLGRIFEPFYTTKDEGKGTGLGLPIVQEIVKAHGGSVSAQSKPDKGTRFDVCLPTGHPQALEA